MGKSFRVWYLLLRLFAAAAALSATIIMATSHDSTTLFGITLEAKLQYNPALKFFVIANGLGFCYSLIAFFIPSSLVSRLVIMFDVIIAMLLTAAIAAAGAMAQLGKHGNTHAGWQPYVTKFPTFVIM